MRCVFHNPRACILLIRHCGLPSGSFWKRKPTSEGSTSTADIPSPPLPSTLARSQASLGPQSCRVSCAARSRRATRPCTGKNCPSRCLGLTHPHGTAKFCGRVLARHDPRCQPPLSVQQSRRELQPLTTNERSGHRMSRTPPHPVFFNTISTSEMELSAYRAVNKFQPPGSCRVQRPRRYRRNTWLYTVHEV